jgi:hypothetical protein
MEAPMRGLLSTSGLLLLSGWLAGCSSADGADTQDAFSRRGTRDVVTGTGVPADTVLKSALPWGLTMSAPWPGATGTASLSFRHDLANYCVHFAMAVP